MNQPPNLSAWLQIPNRIVFFEEQNFRASGKKFKRLVEVFTRLLTRALNANNKTRVLVSPYNSSWRELQPFWVFQRVEIDRIVAYCKTVVQHDCMVSRCCRKLVSHFHSCYRSNREWLKNLKCTQSKARMIVLFCEKQVSLHLCKDSKSTTLRTFCGFLLTILTPNELIEVIAIWNTASLVQFGESAHH